MELEIKEELGKECEDIWNLFLETKSLKESIELYLKTSGKKIKEYNGNKLWVIPYDFFYMKINYLFFLTIENINRELDRNMTSSLRKSMLEEIKDFYKKYKIICCTFNKETLEEILNNLFNLHRFSLGEFANETIRPDISKSKIQQLWLIIKDFFLYVKEKVFKFEQKVIKIEDKNTLTMIGNLLYGYNTSLNVLEKILENNRSTIDALSVPSSLKKYIITLKKLPMKDEFVNLSNRDIRCTIRNFLNIKNSSEEKDFLLVKISDFVGKMPYDSKGIKDFFIFSIGINCSNAVEKLLNEFKFCSESIKNIKMKLLNCRMGLLKITPLHFAIISDSDDKIIELLCQNEADITARDINGFSLLHYAVAKGRVDLVKKLVNEQKSEHIDSLSETKTIDTKESIKLRALDIAYIMVQKIESLKKVIEITKDIEELSNVKILLESYWQVDGESLSSNGELDCKKILEILNRIEGNYKKSIELLNPNGLNLNVDISQEHIDKVFEYFIDAMYQYITYTKSPGAIRDFVLNMPSKNNDTTTLQQL